GSPRRPAAGPLRARSAPGTGAKKEFPPGESGARGLGRGVVSAAATCQAMRARARGMPRQQMRRPRSSPIAPPTEAVAGSTGISHGYTRSGYKARRTGADSGRAADRATARPQTPAPTGPRRRGRQGRRDGGADGPGLDAAPVARPSLLIGFRTPATGRD